MNAALNVQEFYPKVVSNVEKYIHRSNAEDFSNISIELNIYISRKNAY